MYYVANFSSIFCINNSKFVITYVSQTSSNQIYVSWVNLTNGSYTLPTNVSYVIWST